MCALPLNETGSSSQYDGVQRVWLMSGFVFNILCTAQVFEETGFDISGRLQEDSCAEIWEKHNGSQKRTKLFFIPGVEASTEFAPQARKACRFPTSFMTLLERTCFRHMGV